RIYSDLFYELCSGPLSLAFSVVCTALQQVRIDGQAILIDVISSSKLNEVQDYMSIWTYSYDPLVFGINNKLFESLSEEDQELFTKLGKEAAEYQVEIAREKEEEQIDELKEAGMEFY